MKKNQPSKEKTQILRHPSWRNDRKVQTGYQNRKIAYSLMQRTVKERMTHFRQRVGSNGSCSIWVSDFTKADIRTRF